MIVERGGGPSNSGGGAKGFAPLGGDVEVEVGAVDDVSGGALANGDSGGAGIVGVAILKVDAGDLAPESPTSWAGVRGWDQGSIVGGGVGATEEVADEADGVVGAVGASDDVACEAKGFADTGLSV